MYIEQLPKVYQEKISSVIKDIQGNDDPELATAFREWEAEALLGCVLSEEDDLSNDKFDCELFGYRAGWFEMSKRQPVKLL